MDDPYAIIGLIAGTLTTAGYIPQIIKGYRTKSMRDVSSLLLVLLGVGMSLWLAYGLLLGSLPLMVSNFVAVMLVIVLLGMKRKYSIKAPGIG